MATYAIYVWSALAVFLAGLIWDYLSPLWSLRQLRRRVRRSDARLRAQQPKKP